MHMDKYVAHLLKPSCISSPFNNDNRSTDEITAHTKRAVEMAKQLKGLSVYPRLSVHLSCSLLLGNPASRKTSVKLLVKLVETHPPSTERWSTIGRYRTGCGISSSSLTLNNQEPF